MELEITFEGGVGNKSCGLPPEADRAASSSGPQSLRYRLRLQNETLVTYPIPDDRLDIVREVLRPAKMDPPRRKTELTVAILQLVASGRGVAALPGWTVQPFLDRNYVVGRPVGKKGLHSRLYAATTTAASELAYMQEFIRIMRDVSFATLKGIKQI
jgi:LysR family transcriptional regulator for metE and metH